MPDQNLKDPEVVSGAKEALFVSLPYLIVSMLYIAASSSFLGYFDFEPRTRIKVELIKGILFVITTSVLIFFLARHYIIQIKKSERLLSDQREAVEAAQQTAFTKTVVASVAHDSNNMLSSFMVGLELLQMNKESPDKVKDHVERLQEVTTQLSHLNRRLINAAQIDRELSVDAVSTQSVLHNLSRMSHHHAAFEDRSVSFSTLSTDLMMAADQCLLTQALFNILLNAAQASEAGGKIEFIVKAEEEFVDFFIHDNGPGIPVDERRLIFTPYYSTKESGNGIGLVSVRACERGFDARVSIEESHLGGACIRLRIPRAKPEQVAARSGH